ncbi:HAMP domain-containing sensor histidine kinase [Ectobacillus ponti]|uniref:Signal transduction histidine-protein kinase ArlS n=1 Tax=Ectobacillus ponti TaxID=2961894 RepID=A0AA42BPZ0_9BACI|nr:HAMP domain-containing histidine kinase [Ectobacillus ponti]MCP8969297.1 HAMP domain-containing histidine kinase [Ectobacillus ponti]
MSHLRSLLQSIPIKWKLTLWSTALIFVLVASYSVVQYIIMDHWTDKYETAQLEHYAKGVEAYIANPKMDFSPQNAASITAFLQGIAEKHQLIRILDKNGNVLASASREIPKGLAREEGSAATEHWEDKALIVRTPVKTPSFTGTIEVMQVMDIFEKFMDMIFGIMLAAGAGGLVLSFFGGTFIARQLLSKIQVVTDTMHRIRKNGMKERVPVPDSKDEIAQLGILFNEVMDDLEQSFVQQKQFIEDASHELRTPLTIIQGHLSMLNRWGKRDPEVLEKSLQASLKEVERLNALVAELLTLSRAESEQLPAEGLEPSLVNEVATLVSNHFQVLHPHISLQQQLFPEDARIAMPARYLEQTLIILLDNAIKYSPTEQPSIAVRTAKEDGMIAIHVEDRGMGIPAEDLPFVLNRFYRVDKARSRKLGGNGLGLAIAKRLVEAYSGTISLRSTEGAGTTVSLTFPAYTGI